MTLRHFAKSLKFRLLIILFGSMFWRKYVDKFYIFQQDRLRGRVEDIKNRQRIYIKYVQKIPKNISSKFYFLDAGFGKGEFLELLKDAGVKKIMGVDISKNFVDSIKKKGVTAVKHDVIDYLYTYDGKFSGISAFHLIEHFTFPQLFDFLVLCNKKLAKNGILILETPNIENIIVSSTTFYYDHTHIQKVPKLFVESVLKFVGFSKIIFIPLHPAKATVNNNIENLLFGSQDLGIIAYK